MNWKFSTLFDKEFWTLFKKKYSEPILHMARILILLIIIFHFINVSIVPSSSMEPTIHVNDYVMILRNPSIIKRKDIIVFHYPINPTQLYIKRVIGLPGDVVSIENGFVYVNGKKISESYIKDKPNYYWSPGKVPNGEYFVLGDNRNNSNDSHVWGYLPKQDIVGKAIAIVLPFQHFRLL